MKYLLYGVLIVLGVLLLPAACQPTYRLMEVDLWVGDVTTGESISGAEVTFASVRDSIEDEEVEDYLQQFGRSLGATDNRGRVTIEVEVLFPAGFMAPVTPRMLDQAWIVGVQGGHYAETLVLRSVQREDLNPDELPLLPGGTVGETIRMRVAGWSCCQNNISQER